MGRGRPPKADGERKAKDLRIPVTEGQKALVAEAMRLSGQDMAAWARPLLLQAANAILLKHRGRPDEKPGPRRA